MAKPPAKSTATTSTRRRPAPPAPNQSAPAVREPTPPSAASIVAPPGRMYSPDKGQPAAAPASESPLAGFGGGGPEADVGGLGDHVPGPAANPRHPTDRFDHDDELSADEDVVAAAEMDEEETLEQAIERIRPMRKPLGTFSQKLAIEKRSGYHTHWFNDDGNRIAEMLENGWAFRKKNGKSVRRAVGTGRDKGVLWAYAMDLPLVFWLEDKAAKEAFAQEKMDAIKRSPAMAKSGTTERSDAGKFYSPSEMLTVEKRN